MDKINILVVEDEALIAASLVHTLSSLGYTVQDPVATGNDAIHAVKTKRPDLILMDIQLLGAMTGIETAEKIRAIADIPVVYLTAYTDDLRLKQAQLTEPYGYIVKPAHGRELHATIEMALYKHTLDRKLKESELHYRELADSITDIFFAMDYDLRYTHWNKASENLTGIKSRDAIGRTISDLFPDTPEIRKATEIYRDVLKNRQPRTFENQFITGDRTIFFEIQVYPSFEGISVFTKDITERKMAEEALKKESRMRTALLDNIPGCIALILKKDTREIIASNKLAHEVGAVPGKTCFNTCAMRDDNCPFCLAPKLWQTGQTQRLEVEYRGIWYEGIWAPLSEDLFVHYIFDISERKRSESQIQQSRQLLQNVIDNSQYLIYAKDPDGRFILASQTLAEYFGQLSYEHLLGKTSHDFLPKFIADQHRANDLEVISSQSLIQLEETATKNDGIHTFLTTKFPLFDAEGKIYAVCGASVDITERKRMEEALRESEERFLNAFEYAAIGMAMVSPDGRWLRVNQSTCEIVGYSENELQAMTFVDITHPDDLCTDLEYVRRMIFGEIHTYQMEKRYIHKSGDLVWVRLSVSLVRDKLGKPLYFISQIENITGRKVAEDALRQVNKKLKLLSSITRHDINNQLTILVGYLSIINKKQPDPALNEYFQKVATAAQRISSMIKFTKEYESIGVNAPAWQDYRTVVDTAAKEAPLGQVMVKNDIPAGSEIFADPLFVKVCYNLMDNAVRYGGKITTIRFFIEKREGDPIVVCEDDGEGVVADEKEKIFQRGYGKNTGLGLALAREILDITGITIRETGEPGKGARFEMTVPKGAWRIADVQKEL